MKQLSFLTIGLVLLLSSCSTAYRAGQTPDDVYYSPGSTAGGEEKVNKQRSRDDQEYQEYISSQDDAYLRRKVTNRNRWSSIDDFSYWNDCRYNFFPSTFNYFNPYFSCFTCNTFNPFNGGNFLGGGFGGGFGSGFGFAPSFGWNNPYYTLVYYGTPNFKGGGGSVSTNNLAAARNKSINNNNNNYYSLPKGGINNNASRTPSFGNLMKTVFTPSGESYDRASRSFSSNSSGGSMPATSSSAGGNSGGFGSVGSSAGGGRGGRNN
jgi:hypothetical protein